MKKISPSRLADTIARLRKEKNMTQAELSEITGINRALISRIAQHGLHAIHRAVGKPWRGSGL